jgi:hypothetical protein
VAPPASSSNQQASGNGTISINRTSRSFNFNVINDSQGLRGTLSFNDAASNISVSATQITSLTISGSTVRIFGKATINGQGSYDFMVTAADNAPASTTLKDTFGISLSNGYKAGPVALASGAVQITSVSAP